MELANRAKRHEDLSAGGTLPWDSDRSWTEHLRRHDQDKMDKIVEGQEIGHYFLLLGPKVGFYASFTRGSSKYPSFLYVVGDRQDDDAIRCYAGH